MKRDTIDFDNSWKKLIEALFELFMAFFFPAAYALIDWTRKPEFLDKEFQQALKGAKLGRRVADKLVRVRLKDNKEIWVLIHIEVQSQRVTDFEKRMFLYNTLIFQRHQIPVATLVILGDDKKGWKPRKFGYNLFGCKMNFEFPFVKLLDFKAHWEELKKNTNLFALAVMAHLKAIETKGNNLDRKHWKFEIVKRLLKLGVSKEEISVLFQFIDVIMGLPLELEKEFFQEIYNYEEGSIMAKTLLPYQEVIFEQGMEQGVLADACESILDILEERFLVVPNSLKEKITIITNREVLKNLRKTALRVSSIEVFEKVVDENRL